MPWHMGPPITIAPRPGWFLPKRLRVTSIPSGEAFGTPNVALILRLSLVSIISGEAFGTATIGRGAVNLSPTGIATAEALGTASVGRGAVNLTPTGIASAAAFGVPMIQLRVVGTGIPSAEAFGTATIGVTVTSVGIPSGEAFGTAKVGYVVAPVGVASGEAFGTATLTTGPVTVTGTGIASGEAFGTPIVQSGGTTQFIQPAGIASGEAFGALTITTGPVTVTGTGIATAEAFGAATVGRGAVTLTPTGIATAEAFGTATLTTGAVTVTGTGIASAEAFGTATVTPGAVTVTGTGIPSAEAFGTLTVGRGAVTIVPTGIASGEAFGTAKTTAYLLPTGIATAEAFGAPTITVGAVTVTGTGIASAEAFGTATIGRGAVGVFGASANFSSSDFTSPTGYWAAFWPPGWSSSGDSPTISSGQLTVPSTPNYSQFTRGNGINMTGKALHVAVTQIITLGASEQTECGLVWYIDGSPTSGQMRFNINGYDGMLNASYWNNAGGSVTWAQVSYSLTTHKYIRIREDGGKVYWDYSANGTSWTNLTSATPPEAVTSVNPGVYAGRWGTGTNSSAIFDEIAIYDTERFGNPAISLQIAPTGIASAEAFGNTTVVPPTAPGIQFIGASGNEGASLTSMPAHQAGDYISLFIFRDGVQTIPTPPTDGKWSLITTTASTALTAYIRAYMIAESSSETSGTWTNATGIAAVVYRGMEAFGSWGANNNSTGEPSYLAATINGALVTDGTSWYSAAVGHRSTNGTLPAPTGMTNRVQVAGATNDVAMHDTNGGITTWAANGGGTAPVTGETASGWSTIVYEMLKEFSTGLNRPAIVAQRTYQAATGNMPLHAVGDMILVFAFNGSTATLPTVPTAGGTVPTFTQIQAPAAANTCAMRVHYAVATATNHTLGTWTNATNLIVLIIRGQNASPIGGNASQATSLNLTVNLPTVTMAVTNNSSLLLRFSGHRAGTSWNPQPAGCYKQSYDGRVSSGAMACCDVQFNTTTSGALTRTITGTASGNFGCTVEIKT